MHSEKPVTAADAQVDGTTLTRNAAWLVAGEVMSRLIAFGVAIYLARVLGTEGFGRIGAALAAVSYFLIVVDSGLEPYGTREVARDVRRLPRIFTGVLAVRLVLAVAMFGLLAALAFGLPERALGGRDLALIYGGTFFAHALNGSWALRGRDQMGVVAVGVVVQNILYAGAVFLLVRGPGPALIFVPFAHVGAELVRCLLYYHALRRHYPSLRTDIDRREQRRLVSESLPYGFAKALRLVYYQGDVLLVTWLFSVGAAGHFLASHKLVLSLAMLALLYQQNAFPTLSRLSLTDPARGSAFQESVSRAALAFCLPVAVGGAFLSPILVELIYGAEYAPTAAILATMLFTIPLLVVSVGFEGLLLALGRSGQVLRAGALGTGIHILFGLLWIPELGGLGAARASVVGRAGVLILAALYLRGVVGGSTLFSRRSVAVLAAAGLMAMAMMATRELPWFVMAGAGGAVYTVVVLGLGGIRPAELRLLRDRLLGRSAPAPAASIALGEPPMP